MDTLLTIACLIIAIAMLFSKPLTIRIEHHHTADEKAPLVPTQEDDYTTEMKAFDAALAEMHKIMGVNDDEEA